MLCQKMFMPLVIHFFIFIRLAQSLEILHNQNQTAEKANLPDNNLPMINKWHRRRQGINMRLKKVERHIRSRETVLTGQKERSRTFFFDNGTSWKFFLEIICKNRKTKQVIAIARLQTCSKKKTFHKLPESEIFSQKIECGRRDKHIQKRKQQSEGERRDSARPGRTFKKLNKCLLSRYIYNPRASIHTIPKEGWSCLKTGTTVATKK